MIRCLLKRITFSNLASSVALMVSLGGVSYAVTTLPANSVGSAQLQAGAVQPDALGFPLFVKRFTDPGRHTYTGVACNPPPGAPPCKAEGQFATAFSFRIRMAAAGHLLVLASVPIGVSGPKAPTLALEPVIGARRAFTPRYSIWSASDGGAATYQGLIAVKPGLHTVTLSINTASSFVGTTTLGPGITVDVIGLP